MAFDAVSICNRALNKIGKGTIAALTDDNERARRCNLLYDQVRQEELSAHWWNFAAARAQLAYDATTPAFEWSYRYQKPSDCLTVRGFYNSEAEWVIEGNFILTNDDVVYLKYTANEDDPTAFHPLFREALAYRLAMELATHEENPNLYAELEREYDKAILRAMQVGAVERKTSNKSQTGESSPAEIERLGR